jgi:hypothetical protein
MALRWMAAGMFETERQFRPIAGHQQPARLAVSIGRDLVVVVPTEDPVNA